MLPTVPRIAVVVVCEDDEVTREQLCRNLTEDRFTALPAADAEEALRLCRYDAPDAMLLDLALPDASGLDVLREIRAAEGPAPLFDASLPIMVVSGHGADGERVRGLTEGADDYLVKPFFYPELLARLRLLLAGRDGSRRGPARIGELKLDLATRTVEVAGQPVVLANKEFELLRVLAREPQRVFTKDELLREIWGYSAGSRTRTLDSHASRLRRKLDSGGRFVVNCWGVGYRLVEGGMQ
ncbi:MAG: response regulator transcription factor [Solirubrobacterales bacterium]|nr:response regulator transcription factor [Solirubrobacterales bacterium]MCB8970482.1 response regulator transcription factor [Thermoleophilales bacterium]MCO5325643.1 response regulator transcription factor [Solirubrobacterales bacterium]